MKRRDNLLPEWTRTIWASEQAKTIWEPRIERIGALTTELELLTVEAGHRRAAWIFVGPDVLTTRTQELARRGLILCPLQRSGVFGSYASQGLPYQDGQPWHYRALVVRAGDELVELSGQFIGGDNEAIGVALGYPRCCRSFFERIWIREKWLDTTWPMADGSTYSLPGETSALHERWTGKPLQTWRFSASDRWPANILGRWASVRAVPWLPCSFTCAETTAAWGKYWEPLAGGIDADALEWLETLLCASWRWSALHGIAEIETSIFKVSTRTDACDDLHVVEYAGVHELEAGTTGTRFPYHTPTEPQLTKGKSFAAGLEAVSKKVAPDPDETSLGWTQNGFSTLEGMEAAHDVLLEVLRKGCKSAPAGYLMDPNCGNGILLEKIGRLLPKLVRCGIEIDRERALSAYYRLDDRVDEDPDGHVVRGSLAILEHWQGRFYDLVLMMPGRLLELEAVERAGVLHYLKQHARRLLVYAYTDPGYDDLEAYADAAGLLQDWRAHFQIDAPGVAMAAILRQR